MKEIKKYKLVYILLFLILIISAFFRLYRLDALLGFYYDQGRDALKVQEIISLKDFPAIGPTTGIAGLFLGPFWFYLLTPFYFIGKGHPATAAGFIAFFDVGAVFVLYLLGKEFYNRYLGLMAAFFWGFSYYLVRSARWFSNPSPLPFLVLLLIYGLAKVIFKKQEKYLILVAVCLALSLQLEAASAIFFFPSLLAIWLVFKPKLKNKKNLIWFVITFFIFLIPQGLFEIKNNFLMTRNFFSFNKGEINTDTQTWGIPNWSFLKERFINYFKILFSKLEVNPMPDKEAKFATGAQILSGLWLLSVFYQIWAFFKRKSQENSLTFLLIIFLFLPLLFLFFFTGNYGQLYDYYLTGFFPAFILLFTVFVFKFTVKKIYVPIFVMIIIWFLNGNLIYFKGYLSAGVDGPEHITLGNQLQAIDWIYQDANGEKFSLDVYVPPVIPYSYEYLFKWYGQKNYGYQPAEEQIPVLYILWEMDRPHLIFLDAWLARQDGIADTIKLERFGGVTVERRIRK